MRFPPELVQTIRDRTDIVQVVSRHVKLQRAGKDYKGLCPFHQERTPSFHVVPDKGIYHCFGCNASGDAFGFLMQVEGLSFPDAVKELAGAAGVQLPTRELTPEDRRKLRERAGLFDVLAAADTFFRNVLWTHPDAAAARAYLQQRGITDDLAQRAGLGWAPSGWTRLTDHLDREGYAPHLVLEAGLANERDRGGLYDFFRERLIIPIRDARGRVIAFGGRVLPGSDNPAKYVNSRDTELYVKKSVLYGLDLAQRAIRRTGRAILVEGYFDVLSMHEAGFEEAIATCGTALTDEHVETLRRHTQEVIVITDSDAAGMRAAEGMLPSLIKAGIAPFRLDLPDAKDPDELIRDGGAEAMRSALERRVPLLGWVVRRKLAEYGGHATARQRVLDEMTDLLDELRPAEVTEVAAALKMNDRHVFERIKARRPARGARPPAAPDQGWRPIRDMVHLLWLVVHRRAEVADLVSRADPAHLAPHAPAIPAIARLLSGEPFATVYDEEPDPGVKRTLAAVATRDRLYGEGEAALAACQVLTRLARPRWEARMGELPQLAAAAQRAGDRDEARVLIQEKVELTRFLRELDQALRAKDIGRTIALLEPPEGEAAPPLGAPSSGVEPDEFPEASPAVLPSADALDRPPSS